jgi:hypothetical protein
MQEASSPNAQAPVTETPAVEAAPVEQKPQEKDQFAEKLELLTRKQQNIWREQKKFEAERQKFEQERKEYEAWKQKKSTAKQNPLEYLSEAGLSYDELTNFMLNGGKPTEKDELAALRDEFNRLREEQAKEKEEIKNQQTQAQKQAEAQAIESFKEEITSFIEQNKEKYELSAQREATEDIFTTINDAFTIAINEWNKNGQEGEMPKPMSIQEAADVVEDFYEKEVLRLAQANKLKTKLGINQDQGAAAKQPSKTLTNNMASTAASVIPAKNDHDRMRRALEKLGG